MAAVRLAEARLRLRPQTLEVSAQVWRCRARIRGSMQRDDDDDDDDAVTSDLHSGSWVVEVGKKMFRHYVKNTRQDTRVIH